MCATVLKKVVSSLRGIRPIHKAIQHSLLTHNTVSGFNNTLRLLAKVTKGLSQVRATRKRH